MRSVFFPDLIETLHHFLRLHRRFIFRSSPRAEIWVCCLHFESPGIIEPGIPIPSLLSRLPLTNQTPADNPHAASPGPPLCAQSFLPPQRGKHVTPRRGVARGGSTFQAAEHPGSFSQRRKLFHLSPHRLTLAERRELADRSHVSAVSNAALCAHALRGWWNKRLGIR